MEQVSGDTCGVKPFDSAILGILRSLVVFYTQGKIEVSPLGWADGRRVIEYYVFPLQ
jgi:hypothetical protein